jgi:hypothetical protein
VALGLAIALISAAAIGYEILLTRLFAIVLWHHFAAMIISLALLGVGAAGTALAFTRGALLPRFEAAFATFAAGFAVTSVAAFALAQRLPFNPLEVIWDPRQPLYLLAVYLLLAVPFFCAASCVALAISRFGERAGTVYRADLFGAGLGAVLVVGLLYTLPPQDALRSLGGLGGLAAGVILLRRAPVVAAALAVAALVLAAAWPAAWLAPQPSPYKGLSQALNAPDTRVVARRSGPLGALAVVESPTIPFRHAPGLSIAAGAPPPEQLGLFIDADGPTAIDHTDAALDGLDYLDRQVNAVPYHLMQAPRALVLGAGGGAEVLRALSLGAKHVDAVELDPQIVDLVRGPFAAFAGEVYDRDDVSVHVAEARAFVASRDDRWDVIQIALIDSFTAAAGGVRAGSESTLYTTEALAAYLARLAPGGVLAITRWLQVPPRDSLKLFATAVTVLEDQGVADPGARLALLRSWNTVTLLVKESPFTAAELATIAGFCEARGFDIGHLPGMAADQANRFNKLAAPYLYDGAQALLGPDRGRFLEAYKFHIAPASDDRPFYFRFFKWRLLPEVIGMQGRAGLTLLEGGYLVLVATLLQALLVGAVLILLPLRWLRHAGARSAGHRPWRSAAYFAAIGFAFLFVEIAFIQRFTLFLGHPLFAVAVVLAAFLLFAGLGAGLSQRLDPARRGRGGPLLMPVLAISALAGAYLLLLPGLFAALIAQATAVKIALAVALIAPLALAMGMPFPLAMRRLDALAPAWVPWAWAVNGAASVVAAVLAGLLAMHWGFSAVVLAALGLYAIAAVSFPR